MKSIWKTLYEGQEIRIENSWTNGERLFVNNQLQDEQCHFITGHNILLTGHIITKNGERKPIKVNMYARFLSIECRLFVDDEKIELQEVE